MMQYSEPNNEPVHLIVLHFFCADVKIRMHAEPEYIVQIYTDSDSDIR